MTDRHDYHDEMFGRNNIHQMSDELSLDDSTAQRMASGAISPEDAPHAYRSVAKLLQAAKGHVEVTKDEAGNALKDETVAAMSAAVSSSLKESKAQNKQSSPPNATLSSRSGASPLFKHRSMKIAAVAAGIVLSTSGVAAAATGSLPAPLQDAVADAGEIVGVAVPTAPHHVNTDNKDGHGKSAGATGEGSTSKQPDNKTTLPPAPHQPSADDAKENSTDPAHPGNESCDEARQVAGANGCSDVAHAWAPGQVKQTTTSIARFEPGRSQSGAPGQSGSTNKPASPGQSRAQGPTNPSPGSNHDSANRGSPPTKSPASREKH